MSRIYRVLNTTTGDDYLVRANTQAQAIRHVVADQFRAQVAGPEAFKAWRAMRGTGNDERRQIIERVADFIERHGDSRFSDVVVNDGDAMRMNRAGWWRDEAGGRVYLFTAAGMKEALAGFDFKRALDTLQAAGVLPPSSGERSKPERIGGRAVRVYAIQADQLRAGDGRRPLSSHRLGRARMTADELRRLAVLIERTDHDAIDRAAGYLRACADALENGPVAWHYDGRDQIEVYPLAMPAQAQPLRLPEPMTDEEVAALIDETESLPPDRAVRYLVKTGERRVKEANE